MELLQKLSILADAAKYDVACTSSGADKTPVPGGIGSAAAAIAAEAEETVNPALCEGALRKRISEVHQ